MTIDWLQDQRQGLFKIDLQSKQVTPWVLESRDEEGSTFLEWPCWSDDDTAFVARWKGWAPKRIMRLDAGDPLKETEIYSPTNPVAMVSHLVVSPNAKHIAFVESDFDAGETIVKVVATKGGLVRDLVRLPGATESPYGQAIFALAC